MKFPRLTWLPMLERGCCCSLEVCCKVQGYLAAIWSLLNILANVIIWVTDGSGCRRITGVAECEPLGIAIEIFSFLYTLISFTSSVVFLTGITQRRGPMLTPFLVLQYIQVILVIHLAVYVTPMMPIVSLLFTIPIIAFTVYCLLCVNSLRAQFIFQAGGMQPLDPSYETPMA